MAKRYITQDILKKKTLADIFALILEQGQSTRREIEHETGFSWGTVSSNVAYLVEKGYVREERKETGGAGRASYYLKAASEGIASIGLDINRSGLCCEIVALDSCVIKKFEEAFCAQTQAELIEQAESLCRRALDWCEQEEIRVFSLGIAVQGSVNGRKGVCTRFTGIEGWRAYNIKEHFEKAFALPTYLGHDPKCMLLGEMHRRRCESCVLLRIDNAIGMAVLLDGRVLDDTERFELGHTLALDGTGKKGLTLEQCGTLSSVSAVRERKETELFASPEKYEKELSEAGAHLSCAIYNVYTLFKPQRLVLTGKAVKLDSFTESALSLLKEEKVEIIVDSDISAAFGAAVESMKSAIREFEF